jgi:putative acetyltransferase
MILRRATPADAAACADIVNDWIDGTPWMPRVHARAVIAQMIADGLPLREIFVAGDPVDGYLSFNPEASHVVALYTARPGFGIGKALMDRVKEGRDYLMLWTHEPNKAAQRFYVREGFAVVDRNSEGNDGLPELKMEWHR